MEQRTAFGGTRNTIIKCQYDKAKEIMQALMMNADWDDDSFQLCFWVNQQNANL